MMLHRYLAASVIAVSGFLGCLSSAAATDYLADAERLTAIGEFRAAEVQLENAVKADPGNLEAHYRLGTLKLRLDDAAGAEKEARIARDQGYDPERVVPLLARAYLAQAKFRLIVYEFSPTEGGPEQRQGVLIARGYALFALGKPDDARESFSQAAFLNPDAAEPLIGEAKVLTAKAEFAAAGALLERAAKIDANSPAVPVAQAQLLLAKGDRAGAIAVLDKALKGSPDFVAARLQRAGLLLEQGDDAPAASDIDVILAAHPNSPTALYLRAVLFAKAKQYKEADAILQRLTGDLDTVPRANYLLAVVKYDLQQFDQALAAVTRYAARNPRDLAAQKLIARLELETRHPDRAIELLSKLVGGADADAETYDLLGRAFALAGKSEQALQAFQKAVERAPDDAGLRLQLVATHFGAGDLNSAVGDLERSLELAPSSAAGGQFLVLTELAAGRFDAAAQAADKLNKLQPDDPTAHNLGGLVKLARFDLDGARQTFGAIVKTHPDFSSARLNLARIAELQGRLDEADAQLGKVLAKDPTDLEALSRLVGLRLRDGDHNRAIAPLESAQRATVGNTRLAAAFVDLYLRVGDKDRALAIARTESRKAEPGDVSIIAARARAELAAGLTDDAIATYRQWVTINPVAIVPRHQLVRLLVDTGNIDEARKIVEEALTSFAPTPLLVADLLAIDLKSGGVDAALATARRLRREERLGAAAPVLIGDAYMAAQQFDKAADAYEKEFRATPTSQLALHLAAARAGQKKIDEAAAVLRQWLADHPDNIQVASTLAGYALAARRFDEARTVSEALVAKRPMDRVALNNLAWLYQQAGDPRARRLAERAYLLAPDLPQTADTLAWILVQQGEPGVALGLLRKAVAAAPGDPAIRYHLAVALKNNGHRDEAIKLLASLIAERATFDDKQAAEKLLAELSPH